MGKNIKKQSSTVSINKIYKAFALTSTIGATIETCHNGDPKLSALLLQCNRAMRVFNVKVGSKKYWEVSNVVNDIWSRVDKYHDTKINPNEAKVVIEMLYNLLPKKDMRAFLNISYTTQEHIRDEIKSELLCMVLMIDEELNKAFSTTSAINRAELGKIMVKPIQQTKKKVKTKKEKGVSRAEKRHLEEVKKHKELKEKRKALLRERVAKAKIIKNKKETV